MTPIMRTGSFSVIPPALAGSSWRALVSSILQGSWAGSRRCRDIHGVRFSGMGSSLRRPAVLIDALTGTLSPRESVRLWGCQGLAALG